LITAAGDRLRDVTVVPPGTTSRGSRGAARSAALGVVVVLAFWTSRRDPVALVAEAAFGSGLLWFVSRRGAAAAQRRRAAIEAALPGTADLVAACLDSGAMPADALATVAEVTGGPIGDRLKQIVAALRLGADVREAWAATEGNDPLAALARAFVRSDASGAPVAALVATVADEQRLQQRWRAEAAARRAGISAVGPLAACFLPGFVLIGIVPLVLAIAADVVGGLT